MKEIYLDYASTAPVFKEVVKVMDRVCVKDYGNPSSLHKKGEEALKIVISAKKEIARELNCSPSEIIFTSGATESNNLAIQGFVKANLNKRKRKIIISSIEHSSVNESCNAMRMQGYKIFRVPVDFEGKILLEELERFIDEDTLLVSIIHGNNIFGTIQDLNKIGDLCEKKGVLLHTDSTQIFGKEKIDVKSSGIGMLSASAHKIGGPKGVGFLYVREGIKIEPLFHGGGQERNLRSGTENVPGIIGFAKALEIQKKIDKNKIRKVRELFITELEKIGGKINGSKKSRLANNIHVSFSGADGEIMVYRLSEKGIYISSGSACESKKKKEEDYVLKAIGLTDQEIKGSLRITIGEKTSEKDVEKFIREIRKII